MRTQKTIWAKLCRSRGAGVHLWALAVSMVLHLAALTALGAVHFSRQPQSQPVANVEPVGIAVYTVQRTLQYPAAKPKPKIESLPVEPQPAPSIDAAARPLVSTPMELPSQTQTDHSLQPENVDLYLPKKGLFFGTGIQARSVCYVVDGSGSMLGLMYLVRQELRESILNLSDLQSFNVLFFVQNATFLQSFEGRLEWASPAAKAEALNFLARLCPQGQTTARQAIETALRLRDRTGNTPEAIYFLTDGFDLMDGAGDLFVREIQRLQGTLAPATVVHTIGIYPEDKDRRILAEMAKACGGHYTEVN